MPQGLYFCHQIETTEDKKGTARRTSHCSLLSEVDGKLALGELQIEPSDFEVIAPRS